MLKYIAVPEAIARTGLRLVLTAGVPGPWSEAAKAIFYIKGVEYIPVMQTAGVRDDALRQWTGQESAPAAMFNEERPRIRWDEILFLAERLGSKPGLVPDDQGLRTDMFGLAHAICGEDGLGWNGRICGMEAQTTVQKNSERRSVVSADQLVNMKVRYGDSSRTGAEAKSRMIRILELLAERLRGSRRRGSSYLVGDQLTALDIYWTAFSNMISPIAQEYCPMPAGYRALGTWLGNTVNEVLDPALIAHRDEILVKHFKLPMLF